MIGTLNSFDMIANHVSQSFIITIKGIGGSRVKSQISFVLTYVVALHLRIPKWAHLASNSARPRLLFGGRWYEVWFSRKMTHFYRKMAQKRPQKLPKSPKMWRLGTLGMPVLLSGLGFRVIRKVYAAILKILIFWPFLAGQRSRFCNFQFLVKILYHPET